MGCPYHMLCSDREPCLLCQRDRLRAENAALQRELESEVNGHRESIDATRKRAAHAEAERDALRAQLAENGRLLEEAKARLEAAFVARSEALERVERLEAALRDCIDALMGELSQPRAIAGARAALEKEPKNG